MGVLWVTGGRRRRQVTNRQGCGEVAGKAGGAVRGDEAAGRKSFFFEEKKQKTFIKRGLWPARRQSPDKSEFSWLRCVHSETCLLCWGFRIGRLRVLHAGAAEADVTASHQYWSSGGRRTDDAGCRGDGGGERS
jgi:hypothetical protein